MKKPFKETKLGQWLTTKAPKIGNVVGNLLPDKGVLGIIKHAISSDPDIPNEVKLEFEKLQQEFEIELIELAMADRANARNRETEFVKATGHIDWMMTITGSLVLSAFVALLIVICFKEIPAKNEHLVINAIGVIEGLVGLVVGYYYGSSAGSRIKDMKG